MKEVFRSEVNVQIGIGQRGTEGVIATKKENVTEATEEDHVLENDASVPEGIVKRLIN